MQNGRIFSAGNKPSFHNMMTKSYKVGKNNSKEMKKIEHIGNFYSISYKYFEILGTGAFGIVRPCKKAGIL